MWQGQDRGIGESGTYRSGRTDGAIVARHSKRTILGTTAAALTVVVAGGAGVASAAGGDDDATDRAITGSALSQASAAALEHTGEGRVTETEVGDGEGAYEVEVTLDDGTETDVHLDKDFKVLGSEVESGDEDGSDD